MRCPSFLQETIAQAKASPLWAVAFGAALLIPWMLIVARAGMEICGGLIGLLFLFHSARTRNWRWLKAPFTLLCMAMWLWLTLVVTPLAAKPEASLVPALLWFRMPLMFVALRYWVLAPAHARIFWSVMAAGLLALVAVDTLWQYATSMSITGHPRLVSGRLTGPFLNPKVGMFLSRFLLPGIAIGLVVAIQQRHRGLVCAMLALFVVVALAILFTGERSALLATVLACGIVMGMLVLTERRLRLPCAVIAAVSVAALVGLYLHSDWLQLRMADTMRVVRNYPASDYGLLMQAAYDIGVSHWLHGAGIGGFRELCPPMPYYGLIFRGMHPHNTYAEWFSEAGLPGLLMFTTLVGMLLREAWQQWRAQEGMGRLLPAVALAAVVQHFFPLMGMQSFFSNWSAMLLWYPLGVLFAALPPKGSPAFRRDV